ncbi:Glycerophosphodiester phosphodiesterase [Bertholletia excelsa]
MLGGKMCRFELLVFFLLLGSTAFVAARTNRTSLWQTLSGNPPLVIAHGGFSGIFPHSSLFAYQLAQAVSLSNVILWCDVQLTKDGAGICFPNLNLNNASDVATKYKDKENTYLVDGVSMRGFFSADFNLRDLEKNVSLTQGISSRAPYFDGYQILTVQELAKQLSPASLWLNIQHDAFFTQQNLNMSHFVLPVLQSSNVDYVSSPEVNFLKNILAHKPSRTKLVFRFREQNETEPSTNQTYGSMLKNLTFIKTFASGILVPKSYIWKVEDMYLLSHTSVVSDAHSEGLEVFASDFANDVDSAYNFSYNPLSECMYFIDNQDFSVDGLLSDFPITPSAAIDCFSHIGRNRSGQESPLVISSKGSSGDYPGCTDLAYKHAIEDGVDILDCPVQISKDGVPFCLDSINLMDTTTIAQGSYSTSPQVIPELGGGPGIFTFSLNWGQIQNLTPVISTPFAKLYNMYRNPKYKNGGKFMTLSEFLALANSSSSVTGILISIEHAAYLAKSERLDVIKAVLDTLNSSQIVKNVMIQSTNSSVLRKLKEETHYQLVYKVDENIRSADNLSIEEIQKFANSVVVRKPSVFPDNEGFITGMTDVVQKLHTFNLSVYVGIFRNEFVSQPWDFFSDAYVEINSYVMGAEIDGVITEYPKTAATYRKNRCLSGGSKIPPYMSVVPPRFLWDLIAPPELPPAEAPNPILREADVLEPPLPSPEPTSPPGTGSVPAAPAGPTPAPSGQPQVLANILLSCTSILVTTLSLF